MSFAPPPDFPDDRDNPYAPPTAELRQDPEFFGPVMGATVPATVDAVLSAAWQIFQARMGICLAIVLGVVGLNVAYSLLLNAVVIRLEMKHAPPLNIGVAQLVGGLGGIVIQLWLTLGQTMAMLKIARGQHVEFAEIFRGGRYLVSTVGALILFVLAVLGLVVLFMLSVGLVAYAAKGQRLAMLIALAVVGLAALLAFVVLTLRLTQFIYLIVDRDAGPVGSLELSNRIARGREGQIFLLNLVSGMINLGGLLACFVGVIFTLPVTFLMAAVFYLALTGQPIAPVAGDKTHLPGVKPLGDSDFAPYM